MQKLSEIFEKLTFGELSQVALGGGGLGEVSESNYRAMAHHVKLGLTALYKRFELKRSTVVIELFTDQREYELHSRYAVNGKNSLELRRWIIDTPEKPFGDDVLKILGAVGTKLCPFPFNDYGDKYSINTPTLESIQVPSIILNPLATDIPEEYVTTQLRVLYAANHPNIMPRVGYFDPERTIIELPDSHVQALLYFVASRVHNPIGMGQEFNSGNNWAAKYEAECVRLEFDGNEIDTGTGNTRARRGGWI